MKNEVTDLFIRTHVHHVKTEIGNHYLIINDELFMAIPVIEKGKTHWKAYEVFPSMKLHHKFLKLVTDCYNKHDELVAVRKKGTKKLELTPKGRRYKKAMEEKLSEAD